MNSITIIGCGHVGSLIAFSLLGETKDLFLVDNDYNKVKSVALDLIDAIKIAKLDTRIVFSERVQAESNAYIVCIGENRQNRDTHETMIPFTNLMEEINLFSKNPFIVVVSNPTAKLTSIALHRFSHVYAAGRDLDNVRVKSMASHEAQNYGTNYNHIIEGGVSRFGITTEVILKIREWLNGN